MKSRGTARWTRAGFLVTVVVLTAASACTGSCGRGSYGGDLPGLERRGTLRILMPPEELESLPRRAYNFDFERDLAEQLARELGLEPVILRVSDRAKMLEDLLEGRGDLVVARLTVTDERRKRFAFSIPLEYVRELLVCRDDDSSIRKPSDLAGRTVAVRRSSSYYGTLQALRDEIPELRIVTVDEHLDTEEILHRVANDELDVTVADQDIFRQVREYVDNLRSPFPLTDERPVAWAMRPGSTRLKEAVDQFLYKQALTRDQDSTRLGDLDKIQKHRVLRVLTLNSAVTYFLYRGQQMGFDYELARRFAQKIGCRIQLVVPPRADLLIPWLLEGRGDLVAASMTVTETRRRRVAFTRPYNRVSEVVVARPDDPLERPEDLWGRRIAVRESSSYHETLVALQPHLGFEIEPAPEDRVTEKLIAGVASGEYDLTIADSNILDVELTYRDDIRGAFPLGAPEEIAWMVRPDNRQLLRAANAFLAEEYRGTFYNLLKKKYFENKKTLAQMVAERPSRAGEISPYDDLFRKYGHEIEVDWRLLAAQAFEESRFDPEAESWAGALGLMQVLPRTARELEVDGDLRDPETGIRAGALYLRWLFDLYEPTLPRGERLRFALAAYNAGRGHIVDGRRLAGARGLDPDRWFGNVERVLPLLADPEYAQQARFGYCRCRQPVTYVRRINERYKAYARVVN